MPPGLRDGAHLMGLMPPGAHFHEGASAEEMEQLFASVQQQQQPGGMLGAPTPRGALLGAMPPQPPALQQLLHGFVGSGRSQSHFLPPPTPLGPQLSVPDKVRIRDRATIMARHMFADQGDIYAEQQVQNLLASLAINPAELPRDMPHVHDASWHEVWRGGAVARPAGPPPSVAADVAAGAAHFEAIWADRQQRQQQQQGGGGGASVAWAEEFHAEGRGGAGGGWASEYLSDASATTTATTTSGRIVAADAVDARASSARVVQALGADPKMASSQFFKFMSKMSKGDILFEDNRLVEGPGVGLQRHGGGGGQAWAEEFSSRGVAAAAAAPGSWGDEFHHHQQQQRPHGDWADEFASGLADDFGRQLGISGQQQQQQGGEAAEQEYERLWRQVASGSEWADELAAAVGTGAGGLGDLDDDATFEEWEKLYGGGSGGGAAGLGGGSGEYVFAENNPFLEDTQVRVRRSREAGLVP